MNHQRILDLLTEIDETPYGPEERALIDEAMALAVDVGDEELEYRARMRLTESAYLTGDTDTVLSSFAWCLAKHDSDPSRFPANTDSPSDGDLLWQYKWIPGTLCASPIFPWSDIDAVLIDMREHYQRAALGMSAVVTAQFTVAWRTGRMVEAEHLYNAVRTTPHDEYSHCNACVRSESIGFLAEIGNDDEALTHVEELVDGGFDCGDEPEYALSRVLLTYLRAGRLDDAKTAHLRSYRLSRDNPDKLRIVANHLIFCAITGNEARGLAILERHLDWLAHDPLNALAHFDALVACGLLLGAVVASGHGDVPVRGAEAANLRHFFGDHGGVWTVQELCAAAWTAAARIGDAFDARNGNDYFARTRDRIKSLAMERYDVPINTDAFVPAPIALPDPTDSASWLERSLELATIGDAERAVVAARNALVDATGAERQLGYSQLLSALVHLERWDEAEAVLTERIAALRADGRIERANLEQRRRLAMFGRATEQDRAGLEDELATACGLPVEAAADVELSLAAVLARSEEPDNRLISELLQSAVNSLDEQGAKRELLSALSFQAAFEVMGGNPEIARCAVERIVAEETNRGCLAMAHLLRARLRGGVGEYEAGAEDADTASQLFAALDAREAMVEANSLASALYAEAGKEKEAISRLRFAVRQAELNGQALNVLRFRFGRALVCGDQLEEAIEVLAHVYEDETTQETPPESRAETLYWLGHAFSGNDQPSNAIGAWTSAIELYLEGSDSQGAAKAGLAAGNLLGQFGEHEDAAQTLAGAAAQARKTPDDVALLTDVLHAYGIAQANNGDPAGLENLDEVLILAREHEAAWLLADVTDSRARALNALGRIEEAIRHALTAADRYLEAGDAASAGGSEFLAGLILIEGQRYDEAVAVMRSALQHAEPNPRLHSVIALQLGDALERLGRNNEAADVRALAED